MQRPALLLALLLTLPASGCTAVAVAAAVGTVAYVQYEKNEVFKDYDQELDVVWTATVDALEALGYRVPQDVARVFSGPATEAEIEGEDYFLRVERQLGQRTRLRVRVGVFDTEDNRRRADLIVEEVTSRLD
jgi:hypothetical protein